MKALRNLTSSRSSSSNTNPPASQALPTTRSRSSTTHTATSSIAAKSPAATPSVSPDRQQKPTSAFAFTQINVASFDRAESFFEKAFGWRFIGEPTSPVFVSPPAPTRPDEGRVAPPIAPPPDHRVNYFTRPGRRGVAGALFKFGEDSRAGNYGGMVSRGDGEKGGIRGVEIPSVIQYVAVDDIVIALNAVRLAGGRTVVQPWTERDEMARFALFADTEGNVFGLIQYLM